MNTKVLRLLNFLIDTTLYLILMILIIYIFRNKADKENIKWISVGFYFLYYFLFELFLKQTPGKWITKTKVMSIKKKSDFMFIRVLLRSLVRFIPVDILSYLFYHRGLHDWLSGMNVVKIKNKNPIV